ncbi:hypothetical protein P3339_11180 [Microbulbifer sp. MLAF003]|uniref:hypothetical protein n=1 Tax=unclassified Microbulbifer TaxID=2619833 RepID=UPI0024ACD9CB|nr:hypothetical protein [Microbulbifer sp. MLAF003]WHI53283.1 hypothetical protein P3339_11180 [Microbulbifer sp. MLAF003]
MELIEIYVLCKERTKKLVLRFLDELLPSREEVAEDYPYPEYSDEPECVYDTSDELLQVLEKDESASYSVYWDGTGNSVVKSAMSFFTEDGCMIAGITVPADGSESWLNKLSELVGGEYGYVGFDSPPPDTREEFIQMCKGSDQIRLVAGEKLRD